MVQSSGNILFERFPFHQPHFTQRIQRFFQRASNRRPHFFAIGFRFGFIADPGSLTLTITDAPNPEGVRVAASGVGGKARLKASRVD